jgi:hypothetical protein
MNQRTLLLSSAIAVAILVTFYYAKHATSKEERIFECFQNPIDNSCICDPTQTARLAAMLPSDFRVEQVLKTLPYEERREFIHLLLGMATYNDIDTLIVTKVLAEELVFTANSSATQNPDTKDNNCYQLANGLVLTNKQRAVIAQDIETIANGKSVSEVTDNNGVRTYTINAVTTPFTVVLTPSMTSSLDDFTSRIMPAIAQEGSVSRLSVDDKALIVRIGVYRSKFVRRFLLQHIQGILGAVGANLRTNSVHTLPSSTTKSMVKTALKKATGIK